MEKINTIEQLLAKLDPDYKDIDQYTKIMKSLELCKEKVSEHCHWCDEFYTRNLIAKTKAYELIVLCWQPKQGSPIHNHQGQDCWMHVICGEMTEIQYHCVKCKETNAWKINEGEKITCPAGETQYINDDICLHKIVNETLEPAVTLHLYSYPIETCNIYCCKTGHVTSRKLSYNCTE